MPNFIRDKKDFEMRVYQETTKGHIARELYGYIQHSNIKEEQHNFLEVGIEGEQRLGSQQRESCIN